jgi:hypothetical protein
VDHRTPAWLIATVPILTVGSVILTFFVWLGRAFTGRPSLSDFIVAVTFGLVVAVVPGIVLVVRGARRHERIPIVVGGLAAVIGALAVGGMAVPAIAQQVHIATLVAMPFTAEEIAYDPAEAEGLATDFATQTRDAVIEAGATPTATLDESVRIATTCNLGNLTRSEQVVVFRNVDLSAADGVSAFAAIQERWSSQGLRVIPAELGAIRVQLEFGGAIARWNEEALVLVIEAQTNCFAPPGSATD